MRDAGAIAILATCLLFGQAASAARPPLPAGPAPDPESQARTIFPNEAATLILMARLSSMPVAQAINYRARGLSLQEVARRLGVAPRRLATASAPPRPDPTREWQELSTVPAPVGDRATAESIRQMAMERRMVPVGDSAGPPPAVATVETAALASPTVAEAGSATDRPRPAEAPAPLAGPDRLRRLWGEAYAASAAEIDAAVAAAGNRAGVALALARAAGRKLDVVLAASASGKALYHIALGLGVSPGVLFPALPPEVVDELPQPYRSAWQFWLRNPSARDRGIFLEDAELARVERVAIALRLEGRTPAEAVRELGGGRRDPQMAAAAIPRT